MSLFRRRRDESLSTFKFNYRGVMVIFKPEDLKLGVDFNLTVFIDGEKVAFDREESMRFMREYFAYLDRN